MGSHLKFLLIQITILALFASCQNKRDNAALTLKSFLVKKQEQIDSTKVQQEEEISRHLKKLGLEDLSDTAKWYLYNIYCDYPLPRSVSDTSAQIYLSFLPLKTMHCSFDTIKNTEFEIFCSFFYGNKRLEQFPLDSDNHGIIVPGVRFNIHTKKIVSYMAGGCLGGGSYKVLGPKSRFEKLMQPEIFPFISSNRTNLNPWYKEQLMNHGMTP